MNPIVSEAVGYALSRQQADAWREASGAVPRQPVVQARAHLQGRFDLDRLREAVAAVVERYEILRTTVHVEAGHAAPLQIVHDVLPAHVTLLDASALDTARHEHLIETARAGLAACIDASAGPVFCAAVVRSTADRGGDALLLCLSAFCADAPSIPLLVDEIAVAYARAESPHATPSEAEAPLQYLEYVAFQEEELADDAIAPGREYWHHLLSDTPGWPEFIRQSRAQTAAPEAPSCHAFTLNDADAAALVATASQLSTDPRTLLLACWQALLWRISGQDRLRVDLALDCRHHPDLTTSPGPLTHSLPCPIVFDPESRLADVLTVLHDYVASARQHQHAYDIDHDTVRQAEGRTVFSYVEWPRTPAMPLGLVPQALSQTHDAALRLHCTRLSGSVTIAIDVDARRAPLPGAERIAAAFHVFLRGVLAQPTAPLAALPLIARVDGDVTPLPVAPMAIITRAFEAQSTAQPEAVAIADDTRQVSYAELNALANRIARVLRTRGAGPDVLVALLAAPSIELMAVILAVLKSGGGYVPLDAQAPDARLRYQATDSGARLIIASSPALGVRLQMEVLPLAELLDAAASEDPHNLDETPPGQATAYVIYTSGSTGRPKGVAIPHDALASYLTWCRAAYVTEHAAGAPLFSSLSFDLTVTSLFAPLIAGQSVALSTTHDGEQMAALRHLLQRTRDFGWIKLTPSHLRLLMAQMSPEQLAGHFRAVIVGGEAIAPRDLATWLDALPGVRLLNEYGPTEATVGCCVAELGADDAGHDPVTIGRPIAGTTLHVLDRQQQRLPAGFAGELAIGGAGLARGYLGRAALTAARFIPDPWSTTPGARLYLTGDLARQRDDGTFEFLGRTDDQVKLRGHRVELGEIEAVLAEAPGIRDTVVMLHADDTGPSLAAYVRLDDAAREPEAVRTMLDAHARDRLPDYMAPATYTFIERWPLTPHGKIDRAALPDPARPTGRVRYAPPRTPDEEVLCAIWSRVLHVDRVGIDDHYFELGGDSIRAIQIAGLAHERGIACSIELLFRHHTIRDIAGALSQSPRSETPASRVGPFELLSAADRALLPPDAEDAFPISALQAGMIFHREYEPRSAVYHDIFGYHLRLPLDLDALHRAVQGLVERHPALRTSFHLSGFSEPIQIVHRAARSPLRIVDISHLSPAAQHTAIEAWMEDEKSKEFDYADPPLLWFQVHVRGADSFQFSLSFHHAIIDGWSDATMLIELALSYHELLQGRTPPFHTTATHYREFVQLERAALASDDQRRYWHERLSGSTPLPLPRWPASLGSARKSGINQKPAVLPASVSDGLQRVARELAVPLKSVLLAAHMRVMGLLAGATDVLTTITAVGRPETLDGDKVIGLHLNSMPFRVELSGGTWADLIRETFAQERESLPYRRFPLSELQRLHGRGRLADTSFYYTHYHIVEQLQQIPVFEIVDRMVYEETSFPLVANFGLDPWTQRVTLNVGCDGARFDDLQVQRFCGYYERALTAIAGDVQARYDETALLDADEHRQLFETWPAATASRAALHRCAHDLFDAQARHTPELPALTAIDANGSETVLSYAALDERANRLAHVLRGRGAGPDTPIGICLERSADMAIAVLAVLKAGAVYVPLDPAYPRDRLAYMLRDAGALLVITHGVQRPLLDALGPDLAPPLVLDDAETVASLAAAATETPQTGVAPEHLAYVIYTSGSTGRPKGVALTHLALTNLIQWHLATLGGPRRTLQFASLSFDASFHEIFAAWCGGGTLVLIDEISRKDVRLLARTLREQRVEKAILPGSMLQQLVVDEETRGGLPDLREVIATGERLHVSRALAAFLATHPQLSLHNHYGPSETHVVTAWTLTDAPEQCPVAPPIGGPIHNCTAFVFDTAMQPVPVGTVGELYLGGVCLARGYVGQPAMTAAKFVPHPFARVAGERLYRTGDLAMFTPDGSLEFIGRRDDQVKIRGHRVEPGEVEAAMQAHPRVKDAAVVPRDDQFGEKRLVCYFAATTPPAPTIAELRKHLAAHVPDYMVPAVFVEMPALPLNANGKVNRRALPEADTRDAGAALRTAVAPRDGIEEAVLGQWRRLLGVEHAGIRDDFFELGGHSLLATRAIAEARRVFGVDLQLRELFERPTVEGISSAIERRLASGSWADEPPIEAVDEHDAGGDAPLSYAQERLWIVDQLDGGTSTAYHIAAAVALDGPLRPGVMQRSLAALVSRHAPLRTRILATHGVPRQRLDPPGDGWPLPIVDLETVDADRAGDLVRVIAQREARRPFDLAGDWPLRTVLVRLAPQRHVLLLTLHHIAADGWSIGVLIRELAALHAAAGDAAQAGLDPLPLQYADYARTQRVWLQQARAGALVDHWRSRLDGAPSHLALPVDGARSSGLPRRGAAVEVTIPPAVADPLRTLAQAEGATPFMAVLAGFAALLGRLSGQDDVCVGAPIANRRRVEWEGLIGLFVNTVVLRCRLDGAPSFRTLLARTRAMTLDAYTHQNLPFERLVDALQPPRLPGVQPLFQVMLAWQNAPMPALAARDLEITPLSLPAETAKFDLTLSVRESAAGIGGVLEYNADLFTAQRVAQWAGLLTHLLTQAIAEPDRPIGELTLLEPAARDTVLAMGRGPRASRDVDTSIAALFDREAARRPGALAITCGDRTLTYGDLGAQANRLARALLASGAAPESRIALLLERGVDLVVASLAAAKCGAAYVPLDPSLPQERLATLVDLVRPAVVISTTALVDRLPRHEPATLCLDDDAVRLRLAAHSDLPLDGDLAISPDQLAYVMFTSGSTGEPKAVGVPHRAVVRLVREANYVSLDGRDCLLHFAPASFDASTFEVWGALLNGARLAIVPAGRPSLDDLGDIISRERVTTLWTTAGLFTQLVDTQLPRLAGLRQWLAGGDVLSPAHVRRAQDALPGCRLINGYGPTENTTFTCCHRIPPEHGGTPGYPLDSISVGTPIAGTSVYVLDEALQPVPAGVAGELCTSGDGLARGYLGQAALTAERFVPDPFSPAPGGRLYRTGDRVRWRSDGTLTFLGRLDQQVKIRGHRIEPAEIERALLALEPIQQAVVVPFGDRADSRHLVAFVVLSRADATSGEQLRRNLAATLPDYMVPRTVAIVDALPLTAQDKIDRRALIEPAAETDDAGKSVPPQTDAEVRLAQLFSSVLGVETVGADVSFFTLGGDSIQVLQLVSRARSAGLAFTPQQVFEHQTVAQLAAVATPAASTDAQPEDGDGAGQVPLTPMLAWFFAHDFASPDQWNQSAILTTRETIDAAVVRDAVMAIVSQHDALRWRFVRDGSDAEPRIETADASAGLFTHVDLRALRPDVHAAVQRTLARDVQAGLSLRDGRVLHALWIEGGPETGHALVLTVHHAVIDGYSWRVLLEDFEQALSALRRGSQPRLPAKTTTLARWARHQQAIAGGAIRGDAPFWLSQVTCRAPALSRDFERGSNLAGDARLVEIAFPADETTSLLRAREPEAAGTEHLLLAALAAAMRRWEGTESLLVALEHHGRGGLAGGLDLSRTIGWFTALFPLCLDISGAITPAEILARVTTGRRAVPHDGVSYGVLRYLDPDPAIRRDLAARSPEVGFNYLGQFDAALASGPFAYGGSPERPQAPGSRRPYLLDFTASVWRGQLHVAIAFAPDCHRAERIEQLAAIYRECLRQMLAVPAALSEANLAGADLDEDALTRLLARIDDTPRS